VRIPGLEPPAAKSQTSGADRAASTWLSGLRAYLIPAAAHDTKRGPPS
jgi:hypothetical protein